MEQNFQTSFIPKKPIVEKRAVSAHSTSLLTIISVFIFFAVVLGSIGLYFYKGIIQKKIEDMNNSLTLAKNSFEPAEITRLQVLDKRLRASNTILNNHITVSPIFETLQALTMKTVRYTKFSYSIADDNKIDVKMSGQTTGSGAYSAYGSIALQSDLFGTNKSLIDPVFSNLSLDDKGNVLFDLEFSVDPSFVNYKNYVSSDTNQAGGTATN